MFAIENWTKARIRDVIVLSQKNRAPDDKPGVKLQLEITLANGSLSGLDGRLLDFLFTRLPKQVVPQQQGLDGIDPVSDKPDLTPIGSKLGWFTWEAKFSGYLFELDLGLGGRRSNLELDDSVIDSLRIQAKQGGTIVIRCALESQNCTKAQWSELSAMKSRELPVRLFPPEEVQQGIDDTVKALPARKPEPPLTPEKALAASMPPKPANPFGANGPQDEQFDGPPPTDEGPPAVSKIRRASKASERRA